MLSSRFIGKVSFPLFVGLMFSLLSCFGGNESRKQPRPEAGTVVSAKAQRLIYCKEVFIKEIEKFKTLTSLEGMKVPFGNDWGPLMVSFMSTNPNTEMPDPKLEYRNGSIAMIDSKIIVEEGTEARMYCSDSLYSYIYLSGIWRNIKEITQK